MRRQRQTLEAYELIDGIYQLTTGDLTWFLEIGLSLGRDLGMYLGREREWLYWYDSAGSAYQLQKRRWKRWQQKPSG